MPLQKLENLPIQGKTVLIRVDMNIPIKNGVIVDDTRIRASLPSIEYCLKHGAAVIMMSHLGRPTEGAPKPEDDIAIIATRVGKLLDKNISVAEDLNHVQVACGEVIMLQNVRLNVGEKKNSDALGKAYAALCDIYVNDAFGTAHRAEASTHAVAKYAKQACAGILLAAELAALAKALDNPKRPLVAIVGGSKVSTKLTVLGTLADKVDGLIVGGGIANTFLQAQGLQVGASLSEAKLQDEARAIITKINQQGGTVPLPVDVRVAKTFSEDALATIKNVNALDDDDCILDIGPQSSDALCDLLHNAGTIVWNGPVGVFEFPAFAEGTKQLAEAIANSPAFTIAGGGDTLAAVSQFKVGDKINYVSTGGGAFLEFLEGKELPAVAILKERAT